MKEKKESAIADVNRGMIIGCRVIEREQCTQTGMLTEKEQQYDFLGRYHKGNCIEIHNKEQLKQMIEKVNSGAEEFQKAHYKLCSDLDLEGSVFQTCGINEDASFRGIFDGQGHTISNVVIDSCEQGHSGVFGFLKEAVIYNLNVEGVTNPIGEAGVFAGTSKDSVIQNCSCQGMVMVAKNDGIMLECTLNLME